MCLLWTEGSSLNSDVEVLTPTPQNMNLFGDKAFNEAFQPPHQRYFVMAALANYVSGLQ